MKNLFLMKLYITLGIIAISGLIGLILLIKVNNQYDTQGYNEFSVYPYKHALALEKTMDLIAKVEGTPFLSKHKQYRGYSSVLCYKKHKGTNITLAQSKECLKEDSEMFLNELEKLLPNLKEHEIASCASLAYSIKNGVNAFKKTKLFNLIKKRSELSIYSTQYSKLYDKYTQDIQYEWTENFAMVNGEYSAGVKNRRDAEYNRFMGL